MSKSLNSRHLFFMSTLKIVFKSNKTSTQILDQSQIYRKLVIYQLHNFASALLAINFFTANKILELMQSY